MFFKRVFNKKKINYASHNRFNYIGAQGDGTPVAPAFEI